MSRKCPSCGNMNDDSLGFCSECGEPVDPEVKLAMDLHKATNPEPPKETPKKQTVKYRDDDRDHKRHDEEKKFPLIWLLLGAVIALIILLILFL